MIKLSKMQIFVISLAILAVVIGFFYIEEVGKLGVILFKLLLLIAKAL